MVSARRDETDIRWSKKKKKKKRNSQMSLENEKVQLEVLEQDLLKEEVVLLISIKIVCFCFGIIEHHQSECNFITYSKMRIGYEGIALCINFWKHCYIRLELLSFTRLIFYIKIICCFLCHIIFKFKNGHDLYWH